MTAMMQRLKNWLQTPLGKVLFASFVQLSLAAHLVFYTWPLTARLVPNVVEVLRLPTAFVLMASVLLLALPLLLMSLYSCFRWRQEGVLAERLTEAKYRRPLRTSIASCLFETVAVALLLRFHTRDVAASLPLRLLILALILVFLLWDIRHRLKILRAKESKTGERTIL